MPLLERKEKEGKRRRKTIKKKHVCWRGTKTRGRGGGVEGERKRGSLHK